MRLIQAGSGVIEIALDTEFTGPCEKELFDTIKASDPVGNRIIILDFSGVAFFNNTAINVLVKLHTQLSKAGSRIFALGLNAHYHDVFKLTGLDKAFNVNSSDSRVIKAARTTDVTKGIKPEPTGLQYWAGPISTLQVHDMPPQVINLNVNGRYTAGPMQGFGRLWEKIYTIDMTDAVLTPSGIIDIVKNNFPALQPPENRFYPSRNGINPGEIVLINASTPGGTIATGVFVLYASPDTFTFITPQGHPEAGWVTFKASTEKGLTLVRIHSLARASDPVYEMAFRIAGAALQERIWKHVLESLAELTGVPARVQFEKQCLDPSLQWSGFFNLGRNAQILTMLYSLTHRVQNK